MLLFVYNPKIQLKQLQWLTVVTLSTELIVLDSNLPTFFRSSASTSEKFPGVLKLSSWWRNEASGKLSSSESEESAEGKRSKYSSVNITLSKLSPLSNTLRATPVVSSCLGLWWAYNKPSSVGSNQASFSFFAQLLNIRKFRISPASFGSGC